MEVRCGRRESIMILSVFESACCHLSAFLIYAV